MQLKRSNIMSTVEEGHSPVKRKKDKVGRKGKTDVSENEDQSSTTTHEDMIDVQYQQHLAAKVRLFIL